MISTDTWFTALLWLCGVFGVFWLLDKWNKRHVLKAASLLFGNPKGAATLYLFFLAPGVAIHELSHWIFAKILLVRVTKVKLFQFKGRGVLGFVAMSGKIGPFSRNIIGLAPLIVGLFVLFALSNLLRIDRGEAQMAAGRYWEVLTLLPGHIVSSFGRPLSFLWLYLVFAVSANVLPSSVDMQRWFYGLVIPIGIFISLAIIGNLKLPLSWQETILSLLQTITWTLSFAVVFNLLLAFIIGFLEIALSILRPNQRATLQRSTK